MHYRQITEACFEEKIGQNGLNKQAFEAIVKKADLALKSIKQEVAEGSFPIINTLENDKNLPEIIEIADEIRSNFDELVVLGTGGSTLNPQALVALKQPHEGIDKRVYFIDTVDPDTIDLFIKQIDLENTAFLVTSKSGKTVETLSQFLIFLSEYEKSEIPDIGKHFFIISDPSDNPLRRIAKEAGATILNHEPAVGGRFSTFTNVAMLPALVAGFDAEEYRNGAKEALESFFKEENSPPVVGAALSVAFMQKGINNTVMMPYVDRLSSFATWYRQIWAESLGKNGKGTTPIKAIGTLDQHSQLQLYLDGSKDKFFNLITLATQTKGSSIESTFLKEKSLKYIKGKKMGDINAALQQATADTLIKNNCPVRLIELQQLNERTIGALMMHFILETIITAKLLEINAFDQPAVEEGKILAREILKSGF